YTITVNPSITFSPAALPPDTVGVAYNQSVSTSGGTGTVNLSVNVTSSVPGLVVPASGPGSIAITGTPTAAGTESFTVTATDSVNGTSIKSYSIVVNPAITLSPTTLPGDDVGFAYNQTITASGGTGTLSTTVNVLNAVAGLIVPSSGGSSIAIT